MIKPAKDSWTIVPAKTAMVVIDMQRTFVAGCVGATDIIPRINDLAAACRKVKIPVIFVNQRSEPSDPGLMSQMRAETTNSDSGTNIGARGAQFCDGLNVTPADFVIPKKRYSALIPGSSALEPMLRGMAKDTIIICGLATDICVGTTTSDAMMLGYKVFFTGDATATFSEERQNVALKVYNSFARVTTSDEVMKELSQLSS